MIQESGPKNWSTYTWYQVGTDLGAGASGMIFDADILGYFMNGGDNKEKGHLGYAAFAANPAAKAPTPNVWIWSLAMSNFSKQKDAAWYFMQWASSHRARPVRRAQDGLRQSGARLGVERQRVPRPDRESPIPAISSSTTSRRRARRSTSRRSRCSST